MEIVFFQEETGEIPLFTWLDHLPLKARDKCLARIERLEEMGHELRRPEADYLRGGIHELRAKWLNVNYRILYFFHGRSAVVLSHGIDKQRGSVPDGEVDIAMERKRRFLAKPGSHSYTGK